MIQGYSFSTFIKLNERCAFSIGIDLVWSQIVFHTCWHKYIHNTDFWDHHIPHFQGKYGAKALGKLNKIDD